VVVFRLKRPSGLVWHDTTTILEAMLKLQPMPETHLDLHLALAQLYVETGDFDLAVRHIDAVLAVVSPDDGRVKTALAKANRVLLLTKARQA
jgi:Flp pilus assembly protein TadD